MPVNNDFPCMVELECDHPCQEFFEYGCCPCTGWRVPSEDAD